MSYEHIKRLLALYLTTVGSRVLARPFPKGSVSFGAPNVPFGSAQKTNNVPFGSTSKPTYF